jgi:hypothetical protein
MAPRRRLLGLGAAAVALAVVVAGALVAVHAWRSAHRTDLQRALDLAPKDAQRYSWTDWAAVRRALGVSATGSAADSRIIDEGYDADLTPASSITSSVDQVRSDFAVAPSTLSWELLSQATSGAALFLKVSDAVSFATIRAHLEAAGFTAPQHADGVWDGSGAGLGAVPILSYAALDEGDHLLVTSDAAGYLSQVMAGRGHGSLPTPLRQVADAVGEPISAEIYGGDYTCSKLAMAQADATDEAEGEQLVADAGKVDPVLGFAMARTATATGKPGDVQVAMAFADHGQAVTNATTRAKLASGDAPGQGGSFPDRFALGKVAAQGSVVTMALRPRDGSPVLSDLSTGPLLFATC